MSASRENKAHAAEDEITGAHPETASSLEHGGLKEAGDNDFEVFKTGEGVNFRTLGWIKASLIFFKRMTTRTTTQDPYADMIPSHLRNRRPSHT